MSLPVSSASAAAGSVISGYGLRSSSRVRHLGDSITVAPSPQAGPAPPASDGPCVGLPSSALPVIVEPPVPPRVPVCVPPPTLSAPPGLSSGGLGSSGSPAGTMSFTSDQWTLMLESNARITVATALDAARAAENRSLLGQDRGFNVVDDLDAAGELSRFPEEVVSIADALPGVNLSEVNRI